MSEFTFSWYIGGTENQANSTQRKYFILNWKLMHFREIERKTSTLSIIWWSKLIQFSFAQLQIYS